VISLTELTIETRIKVVNQEKIEKRWIYAILLW